MFFSKVKGFSLLELLIAMTLSALLITVLSSGFYQLSFNWDEKTKQTEQKIDQAMIISELEKAISAAYPYMYQDKRKKQRMFFLGKKSEMVWVSTFSPNYQQRSMIWQMKTVEDGGLEIKVLPLLTSNPLQYIEKDKQEATKILSEYKIKINYLKVKNEISNWRQRWDADKTYTLPDAIQLQLKAKDTESDENQDFNLIVPIRANRHLQHREKKLGQ